MVERVIIEKLFESRRISEASFEADGSRYSTAFGRYSRDGESISREEYFKAKEKLVGDTSSNTPSEKKVSNDDFDVESMSKVANSPVKKGKEGPYYYDSGDMDSFNKSVEGLTASFQEKYTGAQTVNTSKNQTVTYDEESGYAIVVKRSNTAGKSWVQYKKLTDKDKELIAKSSSEETSSQATSDSDNDDEILVQKANGGDSAAQEALIKKYEKLAYHLAKDLYLPGGDKDDLAQEALMGLVSAMNDYQPGKNKNFKQFAILAMKRNMQDAIRSANRYKNDPLNRSEDYETSLEVTPSSDTPEKSYIEKSDKERLVKYMNDNLTDWHREVLGYYLKGYTYDEIAEKTGKNNKSINNAMNHVRSRLRKYKELYSESKLVEMIMESIQSNSKESMMEAYNYLYR